MISFLLILWKETEKHTLYVLGCKWKGRHYLFCNSAAVKLLMEELKIAVDYINENPKDTASQSYDLMGGSVEGLELFLERVTYRHEPSLNVIEPIIEYLKVLGDSKAFAYVGGNEEVREMFGV